MDLENRAEVLEVPYSLCNYKWVLSFHCIQVACLRIRGIMTHKMCFHQRSQHFVKKIVIYKNREIQ